jgi:hypothetical protein
MDFCKQLEDYLINDQIESANKFYNTAIIELKKTYYWELASLFCTYLNKHYDENRLCDEIGEFCLEASIDLCKNNYANPKEIILIYLENSSKFQVTDGKFLKFIEILKYILSSIPPKQLYYSFKLTTGAIYNFLKTLEIPKDLNLAENEKQVFDHDLRVDRIIELTNAYIDFLDNFIEKCEKNDRLKELMITCLVNLYDKPFGGLNIEGMNQMLNNLSAKSVINIDYVEIEFETATIKAARRLFQVILKLNQNLFSIIKLKVDDEDDDDDDDDEKIVMTNRAISVFAYVTFTKHIGLELTLRTSHLPCVYSFVFIFEQLQPCILYLLEQNEQQFLLEKGLKLSYRLFKNIMLDEGYVSNQKFTDFCNYLFKLSIYTNFELVRRLGANLLNFIFGRFETLRGRLRFLNYYLNYSIYEKINDVNFNNYIYSFVIYLLKDEFCERFLVDKDLKLFQQFYYKIFKLENHVECDLMQNSNKIVSTLNLLRFILLKDKMDKTGVLGLIVKNSYLIEIEKAVQMSKAHYELERRNLKKDNKNDVEFQVETLNNNSLKDENVKKLSFEQKIDAMDSSLNTIDMIESLRVRCVELVDCLNKTSF